MKTVESSCSCYTGKKKRHILTHNNSLAKRKIRRGMAAIKLVLSACLFAAIPKCPVCLAGYITLGTGIGISITTATYLRIGLIILCLVSMTCLLTKHACRLIIEKDQKDTMSVEG